MKQTAVEWLESEMLKPNLGMKDILEQAKEMEKQQIIDAYRNGKINQLENSEIYYNETYKNEK